jgi:hypothetical protein
MKAWEQIWSGSAEYFGRKELDWLRVTRHADLYNHVN